MDLQHRHLHADRSLHAHRAVTAAAIAALLLTVGTASAQVSVEVSPLRVELTAGPGSTTTQGITVSNAGTEPLRVRAIATDWDLSRDGAPQFESAIEGGPYSATSWIRVAPPEQVIEPGKNTIVRFSLSVPADVTPGGYRTGVLFEFGSATASPLARGRQVMFKSRIATLIYVSVGQPPMAAELTDLSVKTLGPQTNVIAVVKNSSRRYVRTRGSLILFDQSGRNVREVPVPDVPLLPESEREVSITVIDADKHLVVDPGTYKIELRMDVGLPALLVGETTLNVVR
jgi:P pilus assembly chaperone PapD